MRNKTVPIDLVKEQVREVKVVMFWEKARNPLTVMGCWEISSDLRFNGKREISSRSMLMLPLKPERLREIRLVNLWKRRVGIFEQ
jgi:hypothetical protein